MSPPRPPKPADERRESVVGVKLTGAELERIDAAVVLLAEEIPGVTRSSVVRAALKEGLDAMEKRYGRPRTAKRRKPT